MGFPSRCGREAGWRGILGSPKSPLRGLGGTGEGLCEHGAWELKVVTIPPVLQEAPIMFSGAFFHMGCRSPASYPGRVSALDMGPWH